MLGWREWVQDIFLVQVHSTEDGRHCVRREEYDAHGRGEFRAVGLGEHVMTCVPQNRRGRAGGYPDHDPLAYFADPVAQGAHGKGRCEPFKGGDEDVRVPYVRVEWGVLCDREARAKGLGLGYAGHEQGRRVVDTAFNRGRDPGLLIGGEHIAVRAHDVCPDSAGAVQYNGGQVQSVARIGRYRRAKRGDGVRVVWGGDTAEALYSHRLHVSLSLSLTMNLI